MRYSSSSSSSSSSDRALGNLVSLTRGKTYKSAQLDQPGPVLLGLASIHRNGGFRSDKLRTYGGDSPSNLLLYPGDLYVSLKDVTQSGDLLGAVARVPTTVSVGRLTQDTVALRLSDPANAAYLYWLLRTPEYRAYCRARAMGTTNLSLSREDFLAFPVPPLTRGREALVAVLEGLEAKVASNGRLITLQERLARTLVERAVTSETARSLPDTNLGEVLTVFETGSRPRGGVKGITDGVPSIGAESIISAGSFDFAKTKLVPRDFYDNMRRGRLQDRDVLLYKDGGRPGDFRPHVSMIGEGFPFSEAAINEHVYRLRIQPPYSQDFLYAWLRTDRLTDEMRRRGTGVAIPGLNSAAVRDLPIVRPGPDVLAALQEAVAPLMSSVLRKARESQTLNEIRAALLTTLIPGSFRGADLPLDGESPSAVTTEAEDAYAA